MSDTTDAVDTSKVPVGPNNDPTAIIEALYSLGPKVTSQWLEENADAMPVETAQKVLDWFYKQPSATPGVPEMQYMRTDKDSKAYQRYVATHPQVISQQAQQVADQTGADPKAVAGDITNSLDPGYLNYPQWVLTMAGGPLDDAQLESMLAKYNELTGQNITDKNEFMTVLKAQTTVAQIAAQETLLGSDPDFTYTWRLADGSQTTMERSQYDQIATGTGYNIDTTEMSRLVRLADQLGMSREVAPGQKKVDVVPAAFLAKYLGTTSNLTYNSGKQRSAMGGEASRMSGVDPKQNEKYLSNIQQLSNMLVGYQQNLKVYGDNVGMALVATVNPSLAARLSSTPAAKWSTADIRAANQLFIDTGLMPDNSTNWGKAGYATDTGVTVDILTGTGNSSGGGSGSGRTMPDPVALKQTARDMFKAMFMAEPTEDQLNQFTSSVQGVIVDAPSNQSVDGSARLRDILEKNALYQEFYGNTGGLSDAQYQTQFVQGAQSMLGAEAYDPNTVRSGMRSGNYQTTIGAVAGSKKAWSNSTFLGRLAQAAQTVQENT